MIVFHTLPIMLAPGSVVVPGNWGRIVNYFGERHSSWEREKALEQVRARDYPEKPSRFNANFACPDQQRLWVYLQCCRAKSPTAPPTVNYISEVVDKNAALHRTDWNLVQPIEGRGETPVSNAHLYWTAGRWYSMTDIAPGVQCEEIVTASPLRIMMQISVEQPAGST